MALTLAELRELAKGEELLRIVLTDGEFRAYYSHYFVDCQSVEKYKETLADAKEQSRLASASSSVLLYNHEMLATFLSSLSNEEILYLDECYRTSKEAMDIDSDLLWKESGYIEYLNKEKLISIFESEDLGELRDRLCGYLPYLEIQNDLMVTVIEENDWGDQYKDVQSLDLFNWDSFYNLITDANHVYGVTLRNSVESALERFESKIKERYPNAPIFRYIDIIMLKKYLRKSMN